MIRKKCEGQHANKFRVDVAWVSCVHLAIKDIPFNFGCYFWIVRIGLFFFSFVHILVFHRRLIFQIFHPIFFHY